MIEQYLSQMVSIDSVNPDLVPGGTGEAAMASWLAQTCEALGLEVKLQEVEPGRPNVLARWRGSGGSKSLLLTGHTDVVGTANMTIPPFEPRIVDGCLYGRGAYDMKGGLAAILGAVEALKADDFQPRGDLVLGFVVDEEWSSKGTTALVQHIHADAAILTEPSEMHVCIAHRGFASIAITVEGVAAHGGKYDEGIDAIRHMRYVLDILDRLETEEMPRHTHELLGRASVHASMIEGGTDWCTYPDRCVLKIEHRLLPSQTGTQALEMWETALHEVNIPNFEASAELVFERPGLEVDPQTPIVQSLNTAYEKTLQQPPQYYGMFGWLDAALLTQAGIPTVIIGPGGAGAHAAVEYVILQDVFNCAAVLAETAAQWTK